MIELYKAGPKHAWNWPGVCEYDTETQTYTHYPNWPLRHEGIGLSNMTFPRAALQMEIDSQRWALVYPPELQLPEGL